MRDLFRWIPCCLILAGCAGAPQPKYTATEAIPTPVVVPASDETATFAGGCFWAMQSSFQKLQGVDQVVAGYSGGNLPNPSYERVCQGTTGHAESIEIRYDPKKISYEELVHIFLTDIDPTTLNRQGPDHGTQYRSAIFFHGSSQQAIAEKVVKEVEASKLYPAPIVTEVTPCSVFYPAEGYHQNYFEKHPNEGYTANVVAPEVARFMKMNQARLK